MTKLKTNTIAGFILLVGTFVLCLLSAFQFLRIHEKESIYPSQGLSVKKRLSSYFSRLKDTPGDSDVFLYQGQEEGGNLLILGGTHPNEPAGFVTTVVLIENISVRRGKIIIIPRANNSGFTHNDPQEGNPQRFFLETSIGRREFRFGSRLTNPVHQWPDPALYINPAGQKLAGTESRNLNRCYPGRKKGYLTEKIAHGIMELIQKENIDLGIDLHEAAPEYPVINAIVFHDNSAELAALAQMYLQAEGYELRLETSPPNLRGLSHREWGDVAQIKALLLETANPSQGRLKGQSSPSLIIEGKDKIYNRAARLGRLFVPYPEEGIPLNRRVARHLASMKAILSSFNELHSRKRIEVIDIPSPSQVLQKGIGFFLKAPKGS
jgi:hypothetical protein